MSESARILLSDDDASFSDSVSGLLRFTGYQCRCAVNADSALQLLAAESFNLLVSDIDMPGNEQLKFIEAVSQRDAGLSIILVTGHATVPTAVQAFNLPVVAYLEKPLDPPAFLAHVGRAIERSRLRRAVSAHRQRMEEWNRDLAQIETLLQSTLAQDVHAPRQAFVSMALHNIIAALIDLKKFGEAMVQRQQDEKARHLLEWPQPLIVIEALRETVDVLEKTKGNFKSKELGDLRRKLELLLQNPPKDAPS